jgi:hypothetical protein
VNLESLSSRLKDSWTFNLNNKETLAMLKLKNTIRTFKEPWLLQQLAIVRVNTLNHLLIIQFTVAPGTYQYKTNRKKNQKVANSPALKLTLTKKHLIKVNKKHLNQKKRKNRRKRLRSQRNHKLSKIQGLKKLRMRTPIISRVMMFQIDNRLNLSWIMMTEVMMIMDIAILILIHIPKKMDTAMTITTMMANKKKLKMKLLIY